MLRRLMAAVPLAVLATGGLFLAMRVLTDPPAEPLTGQFDDGNDARQGKAAALPPDGLQPPPDRIMLAPDRAATLIASSSPVYPHCGKGRPGKVIVEFTVTRNGTVSDVEIVQATSQCFATAARLAVLHRRYLPGKAAGQPVNSRIRDVIHFVPPPPDFPRPLDFDDPRPYAGPASPIIRSPPEYPPCASGRGEVVLEFVVEPDGSIREVEVISATSDCFAEAAIAAARKWRYRPKVVDGKPVRSDRQRVTLLFEPDESG